MDCRQEEIVNGLLQSYQEIGGINHLGVGCRSRSDVDERAGRAAADGALVLAPRDEGPPVGYWALLRDPDGHNVELSFGQEVGLTVAQADGHAGP